MNDSGFGAGASTNKVKITINYIKRRNSKI